MKRKKIRQPEPEIYADDSDFSIGKFHDPLELDEKLEEFEQALLIDKNKLDEELQEQSELLYRVGEILSLQISRRDAAKKYLANQEALVDSQLRSKADREDRKTTEKEIAAQTCVTASVVKANEQLLKMEHSVRQWTNLRESLRDRGYAIRGLIDLYTGDYWSATKSVSVNKMRDKKAAKAGRRYDDAHYER